MAGIVLCVYVLLSVVSFSQLSHFFFSAQSATRGRAHCYYYTAAKVRGVGGGISERFRARCHGVVVVALAPVKLHHPEQPSLFRQCHFEKYF